MSILEDIISTIKHDAEVNDVRACVFWTAVVSRHCGLASTPKEACISQVEHPVKDAGTLDSRSALELARLCKSDSPAEAAIGLAALNSLVEIDTSLCVQLNASRILMEKGEGKRIAIVGMFPFIPKLRKIAGETWVFERKPAEGVLPESETERLLPQADVVAISGSAFVNHSMERLLKLCSPEAFVVVLGASSPLSPVLFEHGVDIICGTQVTDVKQVLHYISQGASFRQVKGTNLLAMAKTRL